MADQKSTEETIIKKLRDFFKGNDEFLGALFSLGVGVIFIFNQVENLKFISSKRDLLILMDLLNITVLIFALFYLKSRKLKVTDEDKVRLKNRRNDETSEKVDYFTERTNMLVNQLTHCVKGFIILLLFFYILQLIFDFGYTASYSDFKEVLENHDSIFSILADQNRDADSLSAAKYLGREFLINSTNLFSAVYVLLAFQVLYVRTISLNNEVRILYRVGIAPFAVAALIMICNILFLVNGIGQNAHASSIYIRLAVGIFNGFAMLLLFSRFISMEFFFKERGKREDGEDYNIDGKTKFQRSFYFVGTIIILPLYVVAQPLYAVFNVVNISSADNDQDEVLFKSFVFLICFLGKLAFFYFVYSMIKRRWLHGYLYAILSKKDALKDIANDIEEIDKIHN